MLDLVLDPLGQPEKANAANSGLFRELASFMRCRIAPAPFQLSEGTVSDLRLLGQPLLHFYQAQDKIYYESVNNRAPGWIANYLDNGKPDEIVRLGREKAFRSALPPIIRPDVLVRDGKFAICELDSVPGGFGVTARLAECYRRYGHNVVGDISIEEGFRLAVAGEPMDEEQSLIIVVSDESQDYRDEMNWLASRLQEMGHSVHVAHPRELKYSEDGAVLSTGSVQVRASVVYRFFELFDHRQISKWQLLAFLAQAKRLRITPPPKPFLEEKLWFALFHHPALASLWRQHLASEDIDILREVIPSTWIMDPTPIPPHATIPGMVLGGTSIRSWYELDRASKKERQMVIKPSGFSPNSWGSRGVVIGHDMSGDDWRKAVDNALTSFPSTTSVLQTYIAPDRVELTAFDSSGNAVELVEGRSRITPYYFVIDGEAVMSNVLITHCTKEKKKIHGMRQAIMTVCSV